MLDFGRVESSWLKIRKRVDLDALKAQRWLSVPLHAKKVRLNPLLA